MKAKIVVGLGFGDEGKGITTDYLASKLPNSVVVRYTGGHQAGHTVVKGEDRHVFASYGSGTLRGVPTYISEHCCFYPPYILNERGVLCKKAPNYPRLTIHPLAKLTTPYDIAFNRIRESRLGHGSVGVGIGTTMSRNNGPYKLHALDLENKMVLKVKLEQIRKFYEDQMYEFKTKELKEYSETVKFEMTFFLNSLNYTAFSIDSYDYLRHFDYIIFEGAQGILLDMDFGVYPNVTYGYTSSKNAHTICNLLNITDIDIYYVTRCYLTRHGKGWLPEGEPIKLINNEQENNVTNEWQGELKVRKLDYDLLNYALACDNTYSYDCDKHLVVTCLDQIPGFIAAAHLLDPDFMSVLGSYSPDSKDFKTITNEF